jgi:threonine/homoserine/homoserine lactone efflux protein
MSLQLYLAFFAACIALALLPGPVVTLVIANGLRHGTRAALTNIAGVQAGLAIMIGIVAIGLTSLMATMGYWFDWVRFAGAAYLVWLGIKLIRVPVIGVKADAPPPPPRGGFFLQGFLVLLSNPKVLVFFGAFIPQFMDMSKDHFSQVALLGIHLHGHGCDHRFDLCAAGRPRAVVLLGAADAAVVAHFRRLHDRRRHLAGADAGAVSETPLNRERRYRV